MDPYHYIRQGEKGAWLSIITYIVLATFKLVMATIGQSSALRADGLNNATDVIASIAVLIGLKISRKPPDEDHHYGHFRAEMIASLIAAFIMMTIGIQVLINTAQTFIEQNFQQPDMFTAWTALVCAIVMYGVHLYNLRLGNRINNSAIQAVAQDNKSDALVSIGAFIGILGAQFQLFWLDPLAGLIVGLIICKTAWDIFRDATHTLTDGFHPKKIKKIKESIEQNPHVLGIKDVKGRLHGNQALVDITILVNPELTVKESHAIADRIEEKLKEEQDIPHAHIHIEPYEEEESNK